MRDDLRDLVGARVADAVEALLERLQRIEERLAALEGERDDRPEWITVEAAAAQLGCSADAVRMRVKRGRLVSRRQGRRLYVSAQSVRSLR